MDGLAGALETALLEIHQLERTVMAYKESNQVLLFDRIDNLVKELQHIQKSADGLDIEIPGEVVTLVDEGRNPDLFTREFLEGVLGKNQATKGRVEAFKDLRGHLLDSLDEAFPAEAQAYRDLKTAAADKLEKDTSRQQEGAAPSDTGDAAAELPKVKNETISREAPLETNQVAAAEPDAQDRRVKPKLEPAG